MRGQAATAQNPAMNTRRLMSHLSPAASFDHLVGAAEQGKRKSNAEGLGGLQIDVQLDLACPLDRQVGRLVTPQNPTRIDAGQAICVRNERSVTQQTSGCGELPPCVNRGYCVIDRKRRKLFAPASEERIGADHEPTR